MFLKIIKYDFAFSARIFAALAAILLAVAVTLRLTMPMFTDAHSAASLLQFQEMTMMLLLVGVGIASITQIFQFFNRNFFGASGYLMLTLPVKRLPLILSKIFVSMVWFNFMLLTTVAAMFIMWDGANRNVHGATILSRIGAQEVVDMIELNMLALVAVAVLFLCLTLARTVIGGRRIHGILAGGFGGGLALLYFWLTGLLQRRSHEMVRGEFVDYIQGVEVSFMYYTNVRLTGLRYGRIPLYDTGTWNISIDVFHIAMVVGFAALMVWAMHALMKRFVALR